MSLLVFTIGLYGGGVLAVSLVYCLASSVGNSFFSVSSISSVSTIAGASIPFLDLRRRRTKQAMSPTVKTATSVPPKPILIAAVLDTGDEEVAFEEVTMFGDEPSDTYDV